MNRLPTQRSTAAAKAKDKTKSDASERKRPAEIPEEQADDPSVLQGTLVDLPDVFSLPVHKEVNFVTWCATKNMASTLRHGSAEQARLGTQGYELLVHEIVDVLIKPKTVTIDQQMEANVVTKCGTEQRAARHIIISTVQPRDSVASYQAVPLVPLNAKALVDIYGTYLTSEISPGQGALGAAIPRSMQSNLASTVQSALGLTNTLNICHAGLWTRIWLNLLSTEFAARAAGSEVQWVAPGADMVWNGSVGSGGKSYLMYDTLAQQGRVVFLEMQLEELQDLAPAIRMLLSSYPVFQVRYSVDMQNDLCDASSMQDQPMFEPDGDYTDVNGDMDFMPMAEMFRFEYPGQVVVLTEREEALRAGDLPLGFTEMGALGAPVNGAQPGTLVPAGAFLTGGPYSAERVQRAVTLLANALPDAGGCSSGFLNAVSRLCSPCWMGVYGSESLDQSAAVTATGHQGKVVIPQGPTTTTTLQRAWSLSARRLETQTALSTLLGFVRAQSLPEMLSSMGQISKALSVSVFQALRCMSVQPAALNLSGAWEGDGPDQRPVLHNIIQGTAGQVPPFAVVANNMCEQLFGFSFPTTFQASMGYYNTQTRLRSMRRGDFGSLPWTYIDRSLWLPPASPSEFDQAMLTGVALPGFILDEGSSVR